MTQEIINKGLYAALIKANVPNEEAFEAAKEDKDAFKKLVEIENRVNTLEKLGWAIALGVLALVVKAFVFAPVVPNT